MWPFSKSRIFKLRWKILLIILPVGILPVILFALVSWLQLSNYLVKQNRLYFTHLTNQVALNIDFFYQQYAITLVNVFDLTTVKYGLNAAPYRSMGDEEIITAEVAGNEKKSGLRDVAQEKIDGVLFLYEMDRKSLIDQTDYKVHYGFDTSYFVSPPEYHSIINDPLFTQLKNNNRIKMVFGKLSGNNGQTENGIADKNVIILPRYQSGDISENETFSTFLLVVLHDTIIEKFYSHIEELQMGTLYLLDRSGSIVSVNHPVADDFFEYDKQNRQYIRSGDSEVDPFTGMSYSDYWLLNTDSSILDLEPVMLLIEQIKAQYSSNDSVNYLTNNDLKQVIVHNNIRYVVTADYAPQSGAIVVYFHPFSQIMKPIRILTLILVIISVMIISLIIFIAFFASRYITRPLKELAVSSLHVANGNYNREIEINSRDEIGQLGKNFNHMVNNIKDVQDKLINEKIELNKTRNVVISALAKLSEYRDESTGKHLERVVEYTKLICVLMRKIKEFEGYLTVRYILDISNSSILHDIGKVGIDNSILLKNGKLTSTEFEIMKTHTTIGGDALTNADRELGITSFLSLAKQICYYHHERFDGKGYPEGLLGENIPLSARITALADVYDALTTDRCYRKALSHEEAASIIIESDAGHFDPLILKLFKENLEKFWEIKDLYRD